MHKSVHLPIAQMPKVYQRYLDVWGVGELPLYAPPDDTGQGVYIWPGSFMHRRTIAIVAGEDSCSDLLSDPIFIGATREIDCRTDEQLYENYIFAANLAVNGIHAAIAKLNTKWGLPSGERMDFNES